MGTIAALLNDGGIHPFEKEELLKEKKLKECENMYKDFETPELAGKVVKLMHFRKFEDTTEALAAATASVEGKMSKPLKKLLKKLVNTEIQEELAVADAKLGNVIKDKMDLQCIANSNVQELMRCIRSQRDSLIEGLPKKEMSAFALGLAHSLSRYKLKFSPDKVDTMIVQAIALLDDLDKEINKYAMRTREWYGWHFPESLAILNDNLLFAKTVLRVGHRLNISKADLADLLPEELEEELRAAAEISMGSEVSDNDMDIIKDLCEQVVEITEYRTQLSEYLKNRMQAIAPNLTILVGEMVGARLMAHAGSLMNLAKQASSTVQILGAEKSLFRALKNKKDTPKFGLIYHAAMVNNTNAKLKGKASRMVACKTALAIRVDALGEEVGTEFIIEKRAKLEEQLKRLETGQNYRISGTSKGQAALDKYTNKSEVYQYDMSGDSTLPSAGKKRKAQADDSTPKASKKIKSDPDTLTPETSEIPKSSKKHKKVKKEPKSEPEDEISEAPTSEKKKKKKKKKAKEQDSD